MDPTTVPVTFDFLDHRDGAVLKILTVTEEGEVVLDGDIIGMPHGIRMAGKAGRRTPRDKVTITVAALLGLGVLALPFFCFRWVTGAWTHAWLVVLPPLAFVLALVIMTLGMEAPWLKREPRFPSSLEIPRWANLVSVLWSGDEFMSAREAHLRAESSEDEGQRRRNRQPRQSRTHS